MSQAAFLTEVPYSTMCDLVRKGAGKRKRRSDAGKSKQVDLSMTKLLRNIIYDTYKANEIPTIDIVQRKLRGFYDNAPCSNSTLRRWLKKIGFKFKIINKRTAIMESKRIVEWRQSYLEKIKQFRTENRPIYYLDETWYDTHDTAKKGWTDESSRCQVSLPANKGTRLVIIHCGSVEGWVENGLKLCGKKMEECNVDYHKNMQSDIFEEWFENTLIPNLKSNSVIVLDNAPYHSRQHIKIPNTSSTKLEIQNFLIDNDLYYEESYTKKQLLEVLHTKKFEKQYVIDLLAERYGHTVLRLPPYFCIFNPIELIWGQLKKRIRRLNTFPKFDKKVIELIKSEVSKINDEDWRKKIQKVLKYENEYLSIAKLHNNRENKCIIHLDEDSEDEDEEEGRISGEESEEEK